ncbi:MAG: DUF4178 domain-containing protein [Candidatus Magasanikbacteria bacterium]|jgi:hypothetical protein|nr:DUF4178 domain-containing protein [Candidatus Magasanikbacteria bacterium]
MQKTIHSKSGLRVGMQGTLHEISFTIVGRVRYKLDGVEWYDGYEHDVYYLDEWLLEGNGKLYHLSEDEDGFVLGAPVSGKIIEPQGDEDKVSFFEGRAPLRVRERGIATVEALEGKNPNDVAVGEALKYIAYEDSGRWFVAEWDVDGVGKRLSETIVYEENKVPEEKVLAAFGVKVKGESNVSIKKDVLWFKRLTAIAGICWIGVIVWQVMLHQPVQRYEVVVQKAHENQAQAYNAGSFTVPNAGRAYKFEVRLKSSIGYSDSVSTVTEIFDSQGMLVNTFQSEFWDEGEESKRYSSLSFDAKKAGTYTMKIYVDEMIGASAARFETSLIRGAGSFFWGFVPGVLLFFLYSKLTNLANKK